MRANAIHNASGFIPRRLNPVFMGYNFSPLHCITSNDVCEIFNRASFIFDLATNVLYHNEETQTAIIGYMLQWNPISEEQQKFHMRHGVSNYWQLNILSKSFFELRKKKSSKLHVTGSLWGESTINSVLPAQTVTFLKITHGKPWCVMSCQSLLCFK